MDGVRLAMVLWILQSWECLLLVVSQSCCWVSSSIKELNSGGNVVDDLCHMGWCSGRVMVRRAYLLHLCCSRIEVGGSEASSSIGMIGEVQNAPRIHLEAVFWSCGSLSTYPSCTLHQARDNHPPKIRFLKFLNNPTTN